METKELLRYLGAILGLCAYIPVVRGIIRNTVRQSFASWLLWAILDGISALTAYINRGNFWLAAGYVLGASVVTFMLARKKETGWSKFDTSISILVALCMIVWVFAGSKSALVASVIALCIASIPQIIHTAKKPTDTSMLAYVFFTFGSLASFLGGTDWSIEQRLFPGASTVICLIIGLLTLQTNKRPAFS